MKIFRVSLMLGISLFSIPHLHAETPLTPSVVAGVDFLSAYIYRATVYNDGLVVQPWFETAVGSVAFGAWANMDLDDYGGTLKENKFSEVDLTLTYTLPEIAGWNISLGVAEYLFPNVDNGNGGALPGTREIILAAGRSITDGLSVKTVLSYDVDQVDDYHAALRLSYTYVLTERIAVTSFGQGGYVGKKISADGAHGFYDYNLRLTLTYRCNDHLQLGVLGGYTGSLDTDVLADPSENAYGGVTAIAFF